jgi:hypothetical protein
VTITRIGFIPQTIQISTGEPAEHSFWENPPPTLVPNPVRVVLQAVPPPPAPVVKRKPRKSVSRTRTAAKTPQGGAATPFPDPQPGQPAAPPSQQPPPAASPFPPPPSTQQ